MKMGPNPHIIQWNCNGIATRIRIGEIQRLLKEYNPICICLQHLGKYNIDLKNYKLASESIHNNNELGTAIYVHNDVIYDKINVQSSYFQYTVTSIKIDLVEKFTICNLYNQPIFNYNFEELKRILTSLPKPLLVVGDLNAHSPVWDDNCRAADNQGLKVEEILEQYNLTCLNEENTHTYLSHTNGKTSSVDISTCSNQIAHLFEWNVLEDRYSSDHHPILITCPQRNEAPKEARYKTEKANWGQYKTTIANNLERFNQDKSINESLDLLTECIIQAAEEAMPKTSSKQRKREVPWWSPELQQLVNQKHKLSSRLTHTRRKLDKLVNNQSTNSEAIRKIIDLTIEIQVIKPLLNKTSAQFKRKAIISKTESWKSYVSGVNSSTPIKKIWKKYKKISGVHTRPPRHALNVNGNKIYTTEEICNAIGEQLEKTSSDENYDPLFMRYKREAERNEIRFKIQESNKEVYNVDFTKEELNNALNSAGNTAPGKDKIDFNMIKQLPPNAMEYLLTLYNEIWTKGTFPDKWRHAVVVPIPKPGKDPSNPLNYRPISLTSCLCKVMEKMVNVRLNWILKEKKILTQMQFGAEKGRSTMEPLILLEEHIRSAFNKKTPTIAIFFDIEKAYDATWRYPVMKKMKEEGIEGQLPLFIKNFLSNRTFQVRIDDKYSNTYHQENGTPQGSVLSCTIFKLAINSIVEELPENVRKSLFMDDFALYVSSKKLRQAVRILNIVLRRLEKWSKESGFKFSIDKTKAVAFFKDKRWIKDQPINLTFFGNYIPIVENYKFLGVIYDSHLNFKSHIEYVRGKSRKALNLLKKLSHTTWGADRRTLKMIYKATVLSKLDYGSQIYGSASKASLQRLEPIQNEGLRLITGAFRSSPTESLHVESGEPPLTLHRELVAMKTKVRLVNNQSPAAALFTEPDVYWKQDGSEGIAPYPTRTNRILQNTDINIRPYTEEETRPPPWTINKADYCYELIKLDKNNNIPQICKQEANRHINKKGRHLAIFTDGSKSQEGVGGAAICTTETKKISLPRQASVYTAELTAIQLALNIIDNSNFQKYVIYSDSKSALNTLQKFEPAHPIVSAIQSSIHKILEARQIKIEFCWVPAHVGICGNEFADKAAKEAARLPPGDTSLPNTDYYPYMKEEIYKRWQRQWDNLVNPNKLREIKQNVREWETSYNKSRRIEVVLTRMRIGHSNMTHAHLMTRPHGPAPQCDLCGASMTIKHVIERCPRLRAIRQRTIGEGNVKEILGEGPKYSTKRILAFLKEANMTEKI